MTDQQFLVCMDSEMMPLKIQIERRRIRTEISNLLLLAAQVKEHAGMLLLSQKRAISGFLDLGICIDRRYYRKLKSASAERQGSLYLLRPSVH